MVRDDTSTRTCCSRPPTRPGRRTTTTAAPTSTCGAERAGLQDQLQPAVRHPGCGDGRDFLFSTEYPAIRFLERNGYDVTYTTDVDGDRRGGLIENHKVFLSVGHDEYWSGPQRTAVEAARDAGTSLAFLSGNEVYWKTRWENSKDGTNAAHRTLVCYKETWDARKSDPTTEWTGTWRDPRFSPPSNGGRPENALTGTAFMANSTDLPSGAGRPGQEPVLAQHLGGDPARRGHRDARPAHGRVRVGRGPGQRVPPGRPDPAVDDHRRHPGDTCGTSATPSPAAPRPTT